MMAPVTRPGWGAGALIALLADCLRELGSGHRVTRQVDHGLGYWLLRVPAATGD
jgi:hypothetical protein